MTLIISVIALITSMLSLKNGDYTTALACFCAAIGWFGWAMEEIK